ncbi:MAG: hypothetical protein IID08_04960 [Candidatus Hydrogenedentes bacterium]|nr:hypothetical protein [Candidatus Hydrogenedentota bacterium]
MTTFKNPSNLRFGYSEEEMANAFQSLLQSGNGLPEVGRFDAVYREISCRQGRPDFIAVRYLLRAEPNRRLLVPGLVGPSILNLLKPKAPHTLDYLIAHLEFVRDSIRKSLRQLIDSGHVERTESGAYRLGKSSRGQKPEMWSFELKLNNPKKAVFQAQQSRSYAERAIIVVPPGQEGNYERFREAMQRWHIGLATFEPVTGSFRFVRKGRRAKALSQTHQIYALSQIECASRSEVHDAATVSRFSARSRA